MVIGSYEKCKLYIETHSPIKEPPVKKHVYPCITISRETGAGARIVCEELIKILDAEVKSGEDNWTYFDRSLIEKILDDHNLPKQLSNYLKEEKYNHLSSAVNELLGIHPMRWTLIHKTTESVLQIARMGKAIIVGRGASVITSKLNNVFHVRLIAQYENKVEFVMKNDDLNRVDAEVQIKKEDSSRRNYVLSNFNRDIEDPNLYHIIINTGLLSHSEAARLIAEAVKRKFASLF